MNSVSEQELLPAGEPISIATVANATYGIFLAGSTNIQCYAENDEGAPVSLSVPSYQSQVNNREQVLLMEAGPTDTNVTIHCLTNDEGDYFVGKTVGSALGGMTTPAIAGIVLMGLGTVAVIAGIIWLIIRQGQIKQARARLGIPGALRAPRYGHHQMVCQVVR